MFCISQVILQHIALGRDILTSVTAPRIHGQLVPYYAYVEYDHQLDIMFHSTDDSSDSFGNDLFIYNIINRSNFNPDDTDNGIAVSNQVNTPIVITLDSGSTVVDNNAHTDVTQSLLTKGHNISTTTAVDITQFIS